MVAEKEGIKVEPEALHMIAEKADGGMRDALSIFDQAASFSQGNITYKKVLEDLNILDSEYYFRVIDMALENKASDIMVLFNQVLSKGFDAGRFVNGLASHVRNVLMARDAQTISLLEVSQQQQQRYQDQASRCTVPFLYKALRILNRCDVNYRQSSNKRLLAEITLIEVAQITQPDDTPGAGLSPKRLKSLFRLITASQPKAAAQVAVAEVTARRAKKEARVAVAVATPSETTKEKQRQQLTGNPLVGLSSLSFGSILKPKEIVKNTEVEAFKAADETPAAVGTPFDNDRLGLEWRSMCNRMPQNMVGLASRMKNIVPVITEYPKVEVVAENSYLANQIAEIKPRIEKTLQIALSCNELTMTLRVAEAKEIKPILSRREILDNLKESHHAVSKLISNLQLTLT